MPDDLLSSKDATDLLLKRVDLRLKIWEAITERAYKVLLLGLVGNLAAATFAYTAARQINAETKVQQLAVMKIEADSIPTFIEGAEFSLVSLGALWLASALIQRNLLLEMGGLSPQATLPAGKFSFRKAISVFAISIMIGSGFIMAKSFVIGLEDLTHAATSIAYDLESLIKPK